MRKFNIKYIALMLSLTFFTLGLFTLPDYGINWDTINHLPRGQAYLNFFLTGNKDYSNLPKYEKSWQDPEKLSIATSKEVPRRSLYQNDSVTYNYFSQNDSGHPPLSDILSSSFNYVLFQKLGIVNDIDSYRVYGILLASVLVGLVFWWVTKQTDIFGGIIASLSLALYPLFWAESHFNTEKDIPEAVYFSLLIFSVWKGITKWSWKWILVSGVFFGLALGTKFNVLFSAFILIPWLVLYAVVRLRKKDITLKAILNQKKMFAALTFAPLLGFSIFVLFWPYLWQDIIGNLPKIFEFYKTIGTTKDFDTRYISLFGFNTFPAIWVLITTPLVILLFSATGIIASISKVKSDKSGFYLLILLWFFVVIARVSIPGANIYGGARQIMEYIPAMAMLSGIGAYFARNYLSEKLKFSKTTLGIIGILLFLPITIKLISIHPSENVYFNPIVGGLSGAKEREVRFWGNSFGGAYRQGLNWLNENTEKDANVVYAHELIPNIPANWFRDDITLWNVFRSGYLMEGEYAITLTYDGTRERSYYDLYLEKFVTPRYQVKVDGVSILKVWENSPEYQKYELSENVLEDVSWEREGGGVRFTLPKPISLSRLEFDFSQDEECLELEYAYTQINSGSYWKRLPGVMPQEALVPSLGVQPSKDGRFIYPFTGEYAQEIEVAIAPDTACMYEIVKAKIYYFESPPEELLK